MTPLSLGSSGFFFALIAGMLLACAFQWVFTVLTIAAGLFTRGSGRPDGPIRKIGMGTGIWAMATMGTSLFAASWLSVEMLRGAGRTEGMVLGLTLWAGFLLSTIWLESAAPGSLLGSLFGTFRTGMKSAAASLKPEALPAGGPAASPEGAYEGDGIDALREKLLPTLERLKPRPLSRNAIDQETKSLFENGELREMARLGLQSADRRIFMDMVSGRQDFTREEAEQLADALQSQWNRLAQEESREEPPWPAREGVAKTAAGTRKSSSPFSARYQGFKEFLRSTEKRELNPARLEQEVKNLVMSPEEGYAGMERNSREINRENLAQVLRQRPDVVPQEADSIAELIEAARSRIMSQSEIREHRREENTDRAMVKVREHVYGMKRAAPDYDGFKRDFAKLLENPGEGAASLRSRLDGMDRTRLASLIGSSGSRTDREDLGKIMAKAEEAVQEARGRMETLKREGAERAEALRQVTASAARWLFLVAVGTGILAALGGWAGVGAE